MTWRKHGRCERVVKRCALKLDARFRVPYDTRGDEEQKDRWVAMKTEMEMVDQLTESKYIGSIGWRCMI